MIRLNATAEQVSETLKSSSVAAPDAAATDFVRVFRALQAASSEPSAAALDVKWYVSALVSAVGQSVSCSGPRAPSTCTQHPGFAFHRRLDVHVADSAASVMTPVVWMDITHPDGKVQNLKLTASQFHEMRYQLAHGLAAAHTAAQHPVMQIE